MNKTLNITDEFAQQLFRNELFQSQLSHKFRQMYTERSQQAYPMPNRNNVNASNISHQISSLLIQQFHLSVKKQAYNLYQMQETLVTDIKRIKDQLSNIKKQIQILTTHKQRQVELGNQIFQGEEGAMKDLQQNKNGDQSELHSNILQNSYMSNTFRQNSQPIKVQQQKYQQNQQKQQDALHTVLEAEKVAFTNYINEALKHDIQLKKRIPIAPEQIFNSVQDGIILCKFINAAVPGKIPPISPEAINMFPSTLSQKQQNLNLAIESARLIGCIAVNIQPEFISKRKHIILQLIWQIIKIHISNQITIKNYPEIYVLKREDEKDEIMHKLASDQILLRWLSYHIKRNAGGNIVVKNFDKTLTDSYAYGNVLKSISDHFQQSFWRKSDDKKAEEIISICNKQKIQTLVTAKDVMSANPRLHFILCAAIFNQKRGLPFRKEINCVEAVEAQTEQTRQMKVFKNWINYQGLDGVHVNYLIDDLKNGQILLKIIQRLRPKSVDWKKYQNKVGKHYNVQNCNYVLQLSKKELNIPIIGIGGVDIADGKVTLVLGLVWRMCKVYWEERVGTLTDQELIKWGNLRVPQSFRINGFKDKAISSCKYFLAILDSIQSNFVDKSKLKQGRSYQQQTPQQQAANINYTISVARKLGAQVMMLWEHVKEINPRYISTFMAQLHYISSKHKSY